jgi:catechol 2,3-dioxygenase-like lactoylglutathione lyase family enzyme
MFKDSHAFSGFSVKDIKATKDFYEGILGLDVSEDWMGLQIKIAGSSPLFVYQKDNHEPATFTILNFPVGDIDKAVDALKEKGVTFDQYDLGGGAMTDEKGILRGKAAKQGPDIAWFKDPSGNILSVLSE